MIDLGPNVSEATIQEVERMKGDDRSVEEILAFLKNDGVNAITSIRVLQFVFGVSVAEAQQLLYESETWREMR
jgi:hypothetical protein